MVLFIPQRAIDSSWALEIILGAGNVEMNKLGTFTELAFRGETVK